MVDRAALQVRVRRAAERLAGFGKRLDRECARMNDGLAAIAIALAVIVILTAAVKLPVLLDDRSSDVSSVQEEN